MRGRIVSDLVIACRICQLIAAIPCVQLLAAMIVAHGCCVLERIRKREIHIFQQNVAVQVESQTDFRQTLGDRVDGIQHAANNEHIANFMMIDADVPAVLKLQRLCVQLGDVRVVRVRGAEDHPQAVVFHVEVHVAVLRCVEVIRAACRSFRDDYRLWK